jgi:sulfur carrier protein
MIETTVNGAPRSLPEGTTLAALLRTLNAPDAGVAVAINREVVPRTEHAARVLAHGDQIEVLRAVGGG